jgi:glycosyltransferase involved in cell wall biosynthesis
MKKNVTPQKTILIFSQSIEPNGTSGSETILIEIFRRIAKNFNINLYTWKPGYEFYKGQKFDSVKYIVSNVPLFNNFYISFFTRVVYGLTLGFRLRVSNPDNTYIYPASDFWPDAIPAIILKIRYPKIRLLGTFFLTAPNPFIGFKEKGSIKLPSINGIFYWLMQKPVFWFYRRFADGIIVTSEPDLIGFSKQVNRKHFVVIRGGVDISGIKKFESENKTVLKEKKYDAVFMGRFHPQKGVLELIDIWGKVLKTNAKLKLVMIGDGPLMQQAKDKIKKLKLEKEIKLTGYILKPEERYKIFMQSKIALHPAIYDSGGMAVAEPMAFGLPAIAFDLEALKTYYLKGILKVKINDYNGFAVAILKLLKDKLLYKKTQQEAVEEVYGRWNWGERATAFAKFVDSFN